MFMKSGRAEGMAYSLSRYTDVPAAKWAWFLDALKQKRMMGFDPRTAIPSEWSLRPDDTLGLVFWTKDPTNLIFERDRLRDYRVKIHVTATGWEEVERGAPNLRQAANLVGLAASVFGPENVTWRFSPVPDVPDVEDRFSTILAMASHYGLKRVYLSFLQENDLLPETRPLQDKLNTLVRVAEAAAQRDVRVYLCAEDRLLTKHPGLHPNLSSGVCAPPEDFGETRPPVEGCGCALMIDPFTINESCTMGCTYCYAGDRTLAQKKRNTTRSLPVVR